MRSRFRLSYLFALAPLFVSTAIAQSIPAKLTDKELWQLNADFSEQNGSFRSDNFLSNETGFQYVIPELKTLVHPGSVYLGVGPEQNFTYIVALQPKIAFIFDIRRGNMIAHLMYKTLFETSADRAEFLSKLFSRPRPSGLTESATPEQLFDAYITAKPDSVLYRKNLAAIKEYLTKTHGWVMSDSDSKLMDYTYSAYFGGGPELNYNYRPGNGSVYGGGFGGFGMPTYATLQSVTDASGKNWAFLANEANYHWMKDFESKNLLVPVVGDFAGPKAIQSVGKYLKEHGAVVGVFYTSNVEQYLWQNAVADKYYRNVATLPLDAGSTFIRSIGGGFRGGAPTAGTNPSIRPVRGGRLASVISSIQDLLKAFDAGKINSYADVIAISR
ncbi:MAG TPA: hypothetical protein VGM82_08030 [Gemmatimonadaceae bacterium]